MNHQMREQTPQNTKITGTRGRGGRNINILGRQTIVDEIIAIEDSSSGSIFSLPILQEDVIRSQQKHPLSKHRYHQGLKLKLKEKLKEKLKICHQQINKQHWRTLRIKAV
jgi:hypothetical protein